MTPWKLNNAKISTEKGDSILCDSIGDKIKFKNNIEALNYMIKQTDAMGNATLFSFSVEETKDVVTITNRNGGVKVCKYENGLLVYSKDEEGNIKTYQYDERCNLIHETDAYGTVTKVYNKYNQPIEIVDRKGNKTVLTYDTRGNVTKITYPSVNGDSVTETFSYTITNRVLKHTDTRGTVTAYTYDENGMPATKKVGDREAGCDY